MKRAGTLPKLVFLLIYSLPSLLHITDPYQLSPCVNNTGSGPHIVSTIIALVVIGCLLIVNARETHDPYR
jgi:hypothetical protein